MKTPRYEGDPRGHSARIYDDVYDSPAFKSLSPHDVLAYLALLRELKQCNNGNLSLPLSDSKDRGIKHPKTLARSLRALAAVGLIAITRTGGCTKGGRRLPHLYRVTERECYEIPKLHLESKKATNDWKSVTSVEHGHSLIQAAEDAAKAEWEKLKSLGHAVPVTRAPGEPVGPKTRARREPWDVGPGHVVNMVENGSKPLSMRVAAGFSLTPEIAVHRAPHSTPLYDYQAIGEIDDIERYGTYQRLTEWPSKPPVHLFTKLFH